MKTTVGSTDVTVTYRDSIKEIFSRVRDHLQPPTYTMMCPGCGKGYRGIWCVECIGKPSSCVCAICGTPYLRHHQSRILCPACSSNKFHKDHD